MYKNRSILLFITCEFGIVCIQVKRFFTYRFLRVDGYKLRGRCGFVGLGLGFLVGRFFG